MVVKALQFCHLKVEDSLLEEAQRKTLEIFQTRENIIYVTLANFRAENLLD